MLNHTDRIRLHVFGQICLFYLAKDTFVEGAIGFSLPGQLLIANGGAVKIDRDSLLVLQRLLQAGLGGLDLFDRVTENWGLLQHRLAKLFFGFDQRGLGRDHFGMLVLVS